VGAYSSGHCWLTYENWGYSEPSPTDGEDDRPYGRAGQLAATMKTRPTDPSLGVTLGTLAWCCIKYMFTLNLYAITRCILRKLSKSSPHDSSNIVCLCRSQSCCALLLVVEVFVGIAMLLTIAFHTPVHGREAFIHQIAFLVVFCIMTSVQLGLSCCTVWRTYILQENGLCDSQSAGMEGYSHPMVVGMPVFHPQPPEFDTLQKERAG